MSTAPPHPAVDQYLDDLRQATRDLPRHRQRELLAEIEAHLAETAPPGASEIHVREALDRLGDPQLIADAELVRPDPSELRAGWGEWLALPLLLVGGAVFLGVGVWVGGAAGGVALAGLGWLAGVVLLWRSALWTVGEKVLGTLVLPGGILPALYLTVAGVSVESCSTGVDGVEVCTGGVSTGERVGLIALWCVLVAAPIATSIVLGRRLRAR